MSNRRGSVHNSARAHRKRLGLRALVLVGIPTTLAAIYYCAVATPQYESVAVVSVQSNRGPSALFGLLSVFVPRARLTGETALVREYIRSRDMLASLNAEVGFLHHYREPAVDWRSRLSDTADSEARYRYFLDKVRARVASRSNTLTLRVRAFSPNKAHAFARHVLARAEVMVNKMSDRARRDRISLAEREVDAATRRLVAARTSLVKVRSDSSVIDPPATLESQAALESALEVQLARAKADLAALSALHRTGAPALERARQRVASLSSQLARHARDATSGQSAPAAVTASRFDAAAFELEFARRAYGAALRALEVLRVEAQGQRRYLVTISAPSTPDAPAYPHRLRRVGSVFLTCVAALGVLTLLAAAVREHAAV